MMTGPERNRRYRQRNKEAAARHKAALERIVEATKGMDGLIPKWIYNEATAALYGQSKA